METKSIQENIFSIHYCVNEKPKGTVFYFHGGGFVASSESDLPSYQFEALLNKFDMALVDYPLAPDVSLKDILAITEEAILSVIEANTHTDLHLDNIVFYGRSAGAYMAANLCSRFIRDNKRVPDQLIMLYGYTHFNDEAFNTPSPYYDSRVNLTVPQEKHILSLKKSPSSRYTRTLLYMQARKTGKWLDYLSITDDTINEYDVRAYLSSFPHTFLGYSKHDPDVDPSHSKLLEQFIPNTNVFVSDSKDHVFDQNLHAETEEFLKQLLSFLDSDE